MAKTLKMYFKDGSTLILEGCKYIEIKEDYFGGCVSEPIKDLVPHDKDGNIIGYYCVLNMFKYKIEEEND